MSTEPKDETKNDPGRTSDEDQSQERPDADTVVTEGEKGLERFKKLLKEIVRVPKDALHLFMW